MKSSGFILLPLFSASLPYGYDPDNFLPVFLYSQCIHREVCRNSLLQSSGFSFRHSLSEDLIVLVSFYLAFLTDMILTSSCPSSCTRSVDNEKYAETDCSNRLDSLFAIVTPKI